MNVERNPKAWADTRVKISWKNSSTFHWTQMIPDQITCDSVKLWNWIHMTAPVNIKASIPVKLVFSSTQWKEVQYPADPFLTCSDIYFFFFCFNLVFYSSFLLTGKASIIVFQNESWFCVSFFGCLLWQNNPPTNCGRHLCIKKSD